MDAPDEEQITLAQAFSVSDRAQELQSAGRTAECLAMTDRAVEVFRRLVARDAGARHRSALAAELMSSALRLGWAGRPTDALAPAQESVALRRDLASENRDTYLLELVRSLLILAGRLEAVGRPGDGADTAREAVSLCRTVVGPSSSEHDWYHLSNAVSTISRCLRAAGRHEEAQEPTREAVELARTLVELNRSAKNLDELTASVVVWIGHRRLRGQFVPMQEFTECVRLGREVPTDGRRRDRQQLLAALGLQLARAMELERWTDVQKVRAEISKLTGRS